MTNTNTTAGTVPSGATAPSTSACRRHLPQIEFTSSELGIETQNKRPDTGLSGWEREQTSALISRQLRHKDDFLLPRTKLSEAEKEATYADVAKIMSLRLERPVSLDAVRLVAASMKGPNPNNKKRRIGLSAQHQALIRAEAEVTELNMTEVLSGILNRHFEIVPEA